MVYMKVDNFIFVCIAVKLGEIGIVAYLTHKLQEFNRR